MSDIKTKLSTALWCDLKTDNERAAWLLLGRGYETGVVCKSIQNQLAMAYSRLIERHECETCENKRKRLIEAGFLKSPLRQARGAHDGLSQDSDQLPIDRGAWSDVPNATKWVDELRGDEPSTNVEPIGEIVEAHGLIAVSIPEMPPVGTKLYAQPLLNQTCCGCGQSGGYALYCGWCWNKGDVPVGYVDQADLDRAGHDFWVSRLEGTRTVPLYTAPPKREGVSLTDEEVEKAVRNSLEEVYLADFFKLEAMIKEKNT